MSPDKAKWVDEVLEAIERIAARAEQLGLRSADVRYAVDKALENVLVHRAGKATS